MLDWFTTIPGLLIACGVIILIIAIVLFVLGAKKTKKEVASVNNGNTNVNNNINPTVQPLGANVPNMNQQPVQNFNPVQEPVVQTVNPVQDNVVSTVNQVQPNVVTTPVDNTVVIPKVEDVNTPVVNIPVEEVNSVQPEVAINSVATPTVDIETPVVENTNSIYGGEVPTYNFEQPVEKTVTIYGGNDPMEATQALPKIEEHNEPYGGYPEVKIVEPIVEPTISAPVEDVVSIPNPQPVQPEVSVAMPSVSEEPVVAPVIEPVMEQTQIINIPDMEDDVEQL